MYFWQFLVPALKKMTYCLTPVKPCKSDPDVVLCPVPSATESISALNTGWTVGLHHRASRKYAMLISTQLWQHINRIFFKLTKFGVLLIFHDKCF